MDFSLDIPANLWVFPTGMKRHGVVGRNSLEWVSKYGSLAASSWDIATVDGINEKVLVANMLWLVQSEYPKYNPKSGKKGLAISLWAQYALDNFSSVAEAVKELRRERFVVVTDFIPGTDKFTTVHLSLSYATGDSAILEYIGGKLVIHHSKDFVVMTNDPPYEEQLAIARYWEIIPGKSFLPGSVTAADRFTRASFFLKSIPQTDDLRVAAASVFSVIRNVSVPYGFSVEGFPNLSSTRWRAVADHKNLLYYFETVLTPNIFWTDVKQFNFSRGADVLKLDLANHKTFSGEASKHFVKSDPLQFLGLE